MRRSSTRSRPPATPPTWNPAGRPDLLMNVTLFVAEPYVFGGGEASSDNPTRLVRSEKRGSVQNHSSPVVAKLTKRSPAMMTWS